MSKVVFQPHPDYSTEQILGDFHIGNEYVAKPLEVDGWRSVLDGGGIWRHNNGVHFPVRVNIPEAPETNQTMLSTDADAYHKAFIDGYAQGAADTKREIEDAKDNPLVFAPDEQEAWDAIEGEEPRTQSKRYKNAPYGKMGTLADDPWTTVTVITRGTENGVVAFAGPASIAKIIAITLFQSKLYSFVSLKTA